MKKKIEWTSQRLNVSRLKIHPSVQREFDMAHGQSIAQNWQSLVARPLIVVQMTSGDHGFYVVDGQHTRWAAEKVGEKFLDCRVIRAKTKSEMNEIFHLVNAGVKHISPIDSYGMNSRNDSRTSDALSNQILRECNLTVGKGGGNHCIQAVQPVRKAFAQLGMEKFGVVAALLEIIADGGNTPDAATVKAITEVVRLHGDSASDISEISEELELSFPSMKARAQNKCINTSLASSPGYLVDEILIATFGVAA